MGTLVAELNNGQLNAAAKQSRELLERLGQTGVEAGRKIDTIGKTPGLQQTGTQIASTQNKLQGLGASAQRTTRSIGQGFSRAGSGVKSFATSVKGATTSAFSLRGTLVGLTAGFSFNAVISELRGFDASMQRAKGVTQATSAEFDTLRNLALDLGRETRFSAQEAAEGIVFLGQAGLKTTEIVDLLPVSLQLAAGASVGLSRSADVLSNVLSAFNKESGEAAATADVLSATLINSNTNFEQLAIALRQVAPIAANTGTSLQEVSAAVGVLGNNAIQGEQAGTALRAIILSLVDPSTEAAKAIQGLGLRLDDVNPEKAGLIKAFETLKSANLDTAQASQIFGREAAAAATVLVSQIGSVKDLVGVLENADGATQNLADTLSDSLDDAILGSQSAFSGLIQAIGDVGVTDTLTQGFRNVADALNGLTDDIRKSDSIAQPFFEFIGREVAGLLTKGTFGLTGFGEALESVDQFFIDAGKSAIQFGKDIVEAIRSILNFDVTIENVTGAIVDFGDDLVTGTRKLLGFEDGVEDAAKKAGDLEDAVEDLINDNDDLFGSLSDSADAADTAAQGFQALGFAAQDAGQSFVQFGTDAAGALDDLPGPIEDVAVEIEDVFEKRAPGAVEDFKTFSKDQIAEFSDFTRDALDLFGIGLEDVFGDKAADIISRFTRFFDRNFDTINGFIQKTLGFFSGGFGDAADTATGSVISFAATGSGAIDDLGDKVGDLNTDVDSVANSFAGAAANAIAFGAAAAGIASVLGAGPGGQAGAGIGGAFGAFAGSAFGPIGTLIGGAAGGIFGGLLGSLTDTKKQLDAVTLASRDLFTQISSGVQVTSAQITQQFGQDAPAIIQRLNDLIAAFGTTGQTTFDQFVGDATGSLIDVSTQGGQAFKLLSDVTGSVASSIADAFQVSALDVLSVLRTLPPGFLATFDALDANSQAVAKSLSDVFGVSVDQILAILTDLSGQASTALGDIDNAGQFAALGLGQAFGIAATDVLSALQTLPAGALDSFSDILVNADLIARNLAVSFGVSADEIKAVLLQIADDAGITADSATTAFSQAFDGLDQSAQATLTSILQTFGLTTDQINDLIAGIPGAGQAAFVGLDDAAKASLAAILTQVGLTTDQINQFFGTIQQSGDAAFAGLSADAQASLTQVLQQFGATGTQIDAILGGIADTGGQSFDQILADAGFSTDQIQTLFQILGSSVGGVFDGLLGTATGALGGIADAGQSSAQQVGTAFQGAGGVASDALQSLQGAATSAFSTAASSALSAASTIRGSFSAAAGDARQALGGIVSAARSAAQAVRSVPKLPSGGGGGGSGQSIGLAKGGLITGPSTLVSSSPFSQSGFRLGGLLPGLTGIIGSVSPFSAAAAEEGEEFVVPAARTRNGELGIKAIAPPGQASQAGPTFVNKFFIDARGAGDEVVKELRAMVRETQKAVPVISAQTAARMMRGVVRV